MTGKRNRDDLLDVEKECLHDVGVREEEEEE